MLIIIMLSAHGFGIQEVRDSNSERMELQLNCLDKYNQASSCVLRENVPPLSYLNSQNDGHFSSKIFAYLVNQTLVWLLA